MRKRTATALILPPILFGLLALAIGADVFLPVETAVYGWISGWASPGMTTFFRAVTELGGTIPVTAACLILLLLPRTRKIGCSVSAAAILSVIFNQVLKFLFQRERPLVEHLSPAEGFSFPSGHSMNNAAVYCMLLLLLLPLADRVWQKCLLTAGCLLPPVLIGVSRIYLGVHFLGDVLCGWLLGAWIAGVVYLFLWKKGFYSKSSREGMC